MGYNANTKMGERLQTNISPEVEIAGVVVYPDRAADVINQALEVRRQRKGLFSREIVPPEEDFINLLKAEGEKQGNPDFALNANFLYVVMVFADDSYKQLTRFANPVLFEKYKWTFDPEQLVKKPKEQAWEAIKTYTGAGYNAMAIPELINNAQKLLTDYQGNIKSFFEEHSNNYSAIFKALVGPKNNKAKHSGFKRFGPKIARLFLQWVDQYDLAELNGTQDMSIPLDFQIIRLMVQTGAVVIDGPTHKGKIIKALETTMPEILSIFLKKYPSYHISETLWLIGALGCNKFNHKACPLAESCDRLISRQPLDDRGLIDPKDTGRMLSRNPKREIENKRKQEEAGQKTLLLF